VIVVLGNSDLRTADHAADLYKKGLAPLVVVTGNTGHGTKGKTFILCSRFDQNSKYNTHLENFCATHCVEFTLQQFEA
jgi:hypothetical protein